MALRHQTGVILLNLLLWATAPSYADIDLGPLFSPPSEQEVASVQAEWSARPSDTDVLEIERVATVNDFQVARVSFSYDNLRQYGLLRYPRHYERGGSYPVLVWHHGGEEGLYYLDAINFDETYPTGCVADSMFVLAPTYRGEVFNGGEDLNYRVSEGNLSLWDHDCDDGMAILTAFLASTNEADASRIFSMGRSRGAAVAYHQSLRDSRIQRTVIQFAASNFGHPYIEEECDAEVNQGVQATNTLTRKVMAHIVQPWVDGEISLQEARDRLTGWSIIHHLHADMCFQIHHGELDDLIPILHSELVNERMTQLGAGPPEYNYFSYPDAGHNTVGMEGYETRVEDYICVDTSLAPSAVPWGLSRVLMEAWPNPFTGDVSIRWEGQAPELGGADVGWKIVDLRGRVIRHLNSSSGIFTVRWDGKDQLGQEAPAGLYFVVGEKRNSPDLEAGTDSALMRGRILKLR